MLKAAASIVFWAIGAILTVILFLAMLFFTIILFPFDRKRKVAHAQCFWWSSILTSINPYWKVGVSGLEHIDRNATYVIVSNHQSLADIIILYRTRAQFKWVAKDSLFSVPVIGWCLRLAKHIKLERGDFSSIKKVYRQAAEWLRSGMSVLFFPEGTRGMTDEMSKFLNGAFKLAIKEKRPILPIVLSGTGETIPRGSWVFNTKIHCTVNVLEPIDTSSFAAADFERLKDLTRARMGAAAKERGVKNEKISG